ncbi:hypothetical protein HYX00_06400 [Candidatus Woesearchaeota archaeon]|nr:hypothetical protein [Candidatus Woesearchaeota archaeon]
MRFNKRASLEISIQAIVIVVLAMTLLGLGLGFIKNMFRNIGDLSSATFDKIADQMQRDLVNSNQKLVFSQSKIYVERGKSILLGWGIKNEGNSKLYYWAQFTPIKCPQPPGSSGSGTCPTTAIINNNWFTFKYVPSASATNAPYSVDVANQQVERVDLTIPKSSDVTTGLYLFELAIYEVGSSSNKYATTDIFLTVT